MKEIHLGPILTENRRKVGITQEDLARFLGVSKAAVSKWETGSAYPDILMLPRLASPALPIRISLCFPDWPLFLTLL